MVTFEKIPVQSPPIFYGNCGLALEEINPCPSCGSTARCDNYVAIRDTCTAREKLVTKGRHSPGRKPFIMRVSGDDLHRDSGKWMNLRRIIDRENDLYDEVITDPETGSIVQESHEPLSKHRGHGAAKPHR